MRHPYLLLCDPQRPTERQVAGEEAVLRPSRCWEHSGWIRLNEKEGAMKAAVVTDFSEPPHYQEFADPVAHGPNEAVVEVLAAGLHQRVRSQADGSHYTSNGELPLVPGIDAVVRDPNGDIRYTILGDTALGTMAERTVIELDRSVVLPLTIDPIALAAVMNPAMSSWVALRRRIEFGDRQRVAVLGATGNAGRIAIQVAKRFGASQVIAVGRDTTKLAELPALGADLTCTFDGTRAGGGRRPGDRLRMG